MIAARLSHRRRLRVLAAILVAAAVAALVVAARSAPLAAAGARQANVVVVLTDDQRTGDMRVMRKTKRLIGRQGATFRNSIATFPLCCPSRATMLTGQYAHNHNVLSNGGPQGGLQAFVKHGGEEATTAVALDEAGYRTGFVGKYLNGYPNFAAQRPPHVPSGWDWWRGMAFPGRMWGWEQVIGKRIRTWGKRKQPRHYQTDVLARQGAAFISQSARRGKPFFLTVSTLAPHGEKRGPGSVNPRPAPRHRGALKRLGFPRTPAFNEANMSDKPEWMQELPRLRRAERRLLHAKYRHRLRSLLAVDDLVERLVVQLRRRGELRDTLFIFTSDNGQLLGEHRLTRKNSPYAPAAEVPLLVRGPGVPRGARVKAPVGNIDLAATIYDITNVRPPLPQDGISLFRTLADPDEERALLIETNGTITAVRTADRLFVEHDREEGREEGREFELYDLDADPLELRSVHDKPEYQPDRALLQTKLNQLRDCAGDSGPKACR